MPKKLQEILHKVVVEKTIGTTTRLVESIVIDSRKVAQNSLFVAMSGTQTDGHHFISKAIEQGASVILCQELPLSMPENVTFLKVSDVPQVLGQMAANLYENPSLKLKLIGITGTNGKTSTATLLFRLFRRLGYRCGLISTVQNQIEDIVVPATHTTPDVVSLNALLARMVGAGCSHVFMEVSSHAVVQERIAGVQFAGGIFTNITHDHLDFHETFDNYIRAKKGFFDTLPASAFALINLDDKRGMVMLQNTAARKATFSLQTLGTFHGKVLSDSIHGLQMSIDGQDVWFKLIGTFNAYNLLGVYGAAVLLGENSESILTELSDVPTAAGRFEQVPAPDGSIGIVDYAHTPDALENVLKTIQNLKEGTQQVITVVGCGGNRDATKRPIMAAIACRLSDVVILTSDNPRYENTNEILAQMYAGVPITQRKKVRVIPDRRQAIRTATSLVQPHDIVLIAGKGHETYQDIAGTKHDFDDKLELEKAFSNI